MSGLHSWHGCSGSHRPSRATVRGLLTPRFFPVWFTCQYLLFECARVFECCLQRESSQVGHRVRHPARPRDAFQQRGHQVLLHPCTAGGAAPRAVPTSTHCRLRRWPCAAAGPPGGGSVSPGAAGGQVPGPVPGLVPHANRCVRNCECVVGFRLPSINGTVNRVLGLRSQVARDQCPLQGR